MVEKAEGRKQKAEQKNRLMEAGNMVLESERMDSRCPHS